MNSEFRDDEYYIMQVRNIIEEIQKKFTPCSDITEETRRINEIIKAAWEECHKQIKEIYLEITMGIFYNEPFKHGDIINQFVEKFLHSLSDIIFKKEKEELINLSLKRSIAMQEYYSKQQSKPYVVDADDSEEPEEFDDGYETQDPNADNVLPENIDDAEKLQEEEDKKELILQEPIKIEIRTAIRFGKKHHHHYKHIYHMMKLNKGGKNVRKEFSKTVEEALKKFINSLY